jgi:hypothetical protein
MIAIHAQPSIATAQHIRDYSAATLAAHIGNILGYVNKHAHRVTNTRYRLTANRIAAIENLQGYQKQLHQTGWAPNSLFFDGIITEAQKLIPANSCHHTADLTAYITQIKLHIKQNF